MITINITEIVEPVTVNISEGILEVQAGDNVNVDNTDPLRPVVSSDALVADVTEQAVLDALGYVPADDAALTAHISDDVIHVTQSDKDNWNGKADFFDTVDGGDANN